MTRWIDSGMRGLFWLMCLTVALVSLRFLVAPMQVVMAHMAHYLPTVPIALFAHILGAPLALALAPFQLWQGLRRARPGVHRAMGYVYVSAVLVAGVGSLALLPQFQGTAFAAAGFACLAVLWIGFTLRGVLLARAGDLAAHRRFMLRSVALTFGAVTLRLIMAPLMAQGWSVVDTYQITAWGCWVPNLVAVEIWLRLHGQGTPVSGGRSLFSGRGRNETNL